MEYDRREPIKGVSGWESTAVTKLSVKQLMAREGAFDQLTQRLGLIPQDVHEKAASIAAAKKEGEGQGALKQPPHMLGSLPETTVRKSPALPELELAQPSEPKHEGATKQPGLFGRLLKR